MCYMKVPSDMGSDWLSSVFVLLSLRQFSYPIVKSQTKSANIYGPSSKSDKYCGCTQSGHWKKGGRMTI